MGTGRRIHHALLLAAALATSAVAALLYVGLQSGRAGTESRFDGRAILAADFAAEYVAQIADKERRVAGRELTGRVEPTEFARVASAQDSQAAVLLDRRGHMLAVEPHRPELVGREFASRYRHLAGAVDGDVTVSDVVPSAVESEPIVAVAVPFDSGGERRVFSSGFQVRHTPLDAFFERSIPITGSDAFLVDGEGTVVASDRDDAVGRRLLDVEPDLAKASTRGTGEIDLAGTETHFAARPVAGTRWHVLLTVPEASLYAPLATTSRLQLVSFLGFLVLLAIGAALAMRLSAAERRLEAHVQQLEATNRTLDTFSHTLVHDLRNPLTAIGGFAQTLNHALGDADSQVREMTRHIELSAQRMHRLIEDVLALATATRSSTLTACDPRRMILEVAEDEPRLDVMIEWLPERVEADHASLSRCFQNLLWNAARYAREDDGKAHVTVSADETPWHWIFRFEDGGPGVGDAERRHIFDAFQRGAKQTDSAGTGLGLSIVAACAAAHGGRSWVESSERGGARFIVEIGKPGTNDRTHAPATGTTSA